jgi:hypothetical protein
MSWRGKAQRSRDHWGVEAVGSRAEGRRCGDGRLEELRQIESCLDSLLRVSGVSRETHMKCFWPTDHHCTGSPTNLYGALRRVTDQDWKPITSVAWGLALIGSTLDELDLERGFMKCRKKLGDSVVDRGLFLRLVKVCGDGEFGAVASLRKLSGWDRRRSNFPENVRSIVISTDLRRSYQGRCSQNPVLAQLS